MKRTDIIIGMMVFLIAVLIFFSFNINQQPSERTIIGKEWNSNGTSWIIISSCEKCETEYIEVVNTDDYKIGDKFP